MNALWAHPVFRSRYLLAVFAGLALTCAFPKIGIAGCAWIAPGLMLAAALGKTGGEAFRVGYVGGLTHYLSLLYWLLLIPYRWHGIPLGPAVGWLALSGFVALFPAIWVWTLASSVSSKSKAQSWEEVQRPKSQVPSRGDQAEPPESNSSFVIRHSSFLPSTWFGRLTWAVAGAAGWVGWEIILAQIFGGFPWELLGASQYQMLPLIQVASVTGVYGVSFIVAWVSLSLVSAGVMLIRRPGARSVWIGEIFLPVFVAAILFNIGFRQLRQAPEPERELSVLLVQPSIPQTLIWDPTLDTNRFSELVSYTDTLLTNKADLVIWPESAIPKLLRYDTNTFAAVGNLARKHKAWMIVGSDDLEPKPDARAPEEIDYFNSSFLISPEGELFQRYIKRNLVIFGEYVPLQRWLPFLKWFTPVQGGFTAGKEPTTFKLNSVDVKTSVLICFEDIFPHLGRTDVKSDTDFLVNITNDGWFGHSAAQWQHATTALFRAVENRVPLLRCCNNGLTCWIDAYGRIPQMLRDHQDTVYGMGYLRAQIPLGPAGQTHTLTFYTRHGDVFGWSCLGFAVVSFALTSLRRRS